MEFGNKLMKFRKDFLGLDGFQWWIGVVEDRQDPEKIGRCRVRIFGIHSDDVSLVPTEDLPWAVSIYSVNASDRFAAPKEGEYVVGFFLDSSFCQAPAIIGVLPGYNKKYVPRELGFRDRRTVEQIKKSPKKPTSISYSNAPTGNLSAILGNVIDTGRGVQNVAAQSIIQNTPLLTKSKTSLTNANQNVIGYNHVITQRELSQGFINLGDEKIALSGIGGANTEINLAQAKKLLNLDLAESSNVAQRSLGVNVWSLLNDAQKAALITNAYESGLNVDFAKSGVRDAIVAGDTIKAAQLLSSIIQTGIDGRYITSLDAKAKEAASLFASTPQSVLDLLAAQIDSLSSPMTAPGGGKGTDVLEPDISNDQIAESLAYPLPEDIDERSINSLATHEKLNNTTLKFRETNIITANGASGESWSEPRPAYSAEYPFNKASETESGHIFELDDTPERERIHLAHRAGSFVEWYPSGTKVEKVVKNNYKVVMSDDHIYIAGKVNVVIESDAHLKIVGDCHLQVENDLHANVSGNVNYSVGDSFNIKANTLKFDIAQTSTIMATTHSNTGTSLTLSSPPRRGTPTVASKFLEKDPRVIQDDQTIQKNNQLTKDFQQNPEKYRAREPNTKDYFPGTPGAGRNPSTGEPAGGSLIVKNPTANITSWLAEQVSLAENGYWRETGVSAGVNPQPSNPNITNLWKNLGFSSEPWTSSDQTAWSMAFINYGLKQNGYRYVQTPSAEDLRLRLVDYGFQIINNKADAQSGDIALWSGGHANFVYQNNNGTLKYVGGSQKPSLTAGVNDRRIGDVSIVDDEGCTLVGIFRPSKT